MTILFKRPNEENTYQCTGCGTVWRESWLEVYQKGYCPFCNAENIPNQLVKLEKPKKVDKKR